jgi:ATP synthase mitochondrial F1 complex assembly factor 2
MLLNTYFAEGYQILLDERPLRTPSTQILTIPHHKPHLASAIALEWDLLASGYQALKQHHIPLTSLVSRALDIAEEDKSTGGEPGKIRTAITETLIRYLDTDSLLCWAPKPPSDPPEYGTNAEGAEDLHNIQVQIAKEIVAFLTARVWPGVEIVPALEGNSIMPVSQPETTRDVIQGWVSALPAFELAGLEKAVLAGKSLLVAARLLVEWSTELRHLREVKSDRGSRNNGYEKKFGIDEAARAGSLEVTYQTEVWGMVEDTHDVDREDLRRQLGSVILLVSGEDA